MRKAVFIDRDDTLVKTYDNRPANTPEELELLPGVVEGMRKLKRAGFFLVLVTNQGGIGLRYITEEVLKEMNVRLNELLAAAEAPTLDAFYWCPHRPREGCYCRKPNPGMIFEAQGDLDIDLDDSFIVGDNVCDVEAGAKAGLKKCVMVRSSHYKDNLFADEVVDSLTEAAFIICRA